MAINLIQYSAERIKLGWVYLETVTPAVYNELNDVIIKLVANNNLLPNIFTEINAKFLKRSGDYINVTANTNLTASQSGLRIKASVSGISIALPGPEEGLHFTIYNSSTGVINLTTSALFLGPYGSGLATQQLIVGGTATLFCDGINWIVIFNNGYLSKTEIFTGEIIPNDTAEHADAFTTTATIPLPSGYTRGQCKYAAFISSVREYYNGGDINKIFTTNQSTGIVTAGRSNSDGDTRYQIYTIGYVCIATK